MLMHGVTTVLFGVEGTTARLAPPRQARIGLWGVDWLVSLCIVAVLHVCMGMCAPIKQKHNTELYNLECTGLGTVTL